MTDWATEKARELLWCSREEDPGDGKPCDPFDPRRGACVPCSLRPAVASALREARRPYREVLIAMVEQYAYWGMKNGVAVIHAGGLSTLEEAFAVLGLPDPCTGGQLAALRDSEPATRKEGE